MKISVVIPLFNKAREICRTLDSALTQVPPPDEVIIVDDGSLDGGASLVRERYGKSVQVISQRNQGVSTARNVGMRQARNEYVCLLDADDEWQPGFLAEIHRLVRLYPDALYYSTAHYFDDEGKRSQPRLAFAAGVVTVIDNFPEQYARGFGLISSSSVCIRKSVFDQGLVFPPGRRRGEDIYYWLRLGMLGKLGFSARFLVKINRSCLDERAARIGAMPYHIEWYFGNRQEIESHWQGKSVRTLIRRNALVTAYALAEADDRATVGQMLLLCQRNSEHVVVALMLPALLIPSSLLRLGGRMRRRLSAMSVDGRIELEAAESGRVAGQSGRSAR